MAQAELARRYGVSRSHVSRLLRGERRQIADAPDVEAPITAAVDAYLADRQLPADKELLATSLRFLAAKMDAVAHSSAVGAAQAAPGLARQFADTIQQLGDGDLLDGSDVLRGLAWLRGLDRKEIL